MYAYHRSAPCHIALPVLRVFILRVFTHLCHFHITLYSCQTVKIVSAFYGRCSGVRTISLAVCSYSSCVAACQGESTGPGRMHHRIHTWGKESRAPSCSSFSFHMTTYTNQDIGSSLHISSTTCILFPTIVCGHCTPKQSLDKKIQNRHYTVP